MTKRVDSNSPTCESQPGTFVKKVSLNKTVQVVSSSSYGCLGRYNIIRTNEINDSGSRAKKYSTNKCCKLDL